MTPRPAVAKKPSRKGLIKPIIKGIVLVVVGIWCFDVLLLVSAKWIDPPMTALHMQRRMQAIIHLKSYNKRYKFVPLTQISPNFQHAVISAEDARFYTHHGFDWKALQLAAEQDLEGGRLRGGSTISQQLVKNLFFGTGGGILRKGAEATLVPVAELILGKHRILELYMNVVEWGPGVYGADAACRYHYKISPKSIGREQAARLAAILPAPLKRKPGSMNNYSAVVLRRMSQVGW